MKKFIVFNLMLFLIVSTALIKNSTKDIDDQIYSVKENILFLENRYKDTKLEFDYLSSSEKLLSYQKLYFENSLIEKSLKDMKLLKIKSKDLEINDIKLFENQWIIKTDLFCMIIMMNLITIKVNPILT